MIKCNYEIEVKRFYVESGKLTKNGKPEMLPITTRKLVITGDFIFSDMVIVNVMKRQGEMKFFVKSRLLPVKKRWPMPFDPPSKIKYESGGSLTKEKFIQFLVPYFGPQAEAVTEQLLTTLPMNAAA